MPKPEDFQIVDGDKLIHYGLANVYGDDWAMVPQWFEYIGSPSWVKAPPMFADTPDPSTGDAPPGQSNRNGPRDPGTGTSTDNGCMGGALNCSCVQRLDPHSCAITPMKGSSCPENCPHMDGTGELITDPVTGLTAPCKGPKSGKAPRVGDQWCQ